MLPTLTLPNTDLRVSRLCLGTNQFGTAFDQSKVDATLDRFVELGGNFIDTARMYGDWVPGIPPGASERAIGAWLAKRRRDALVVATKGGGMDLRAGDWKARVTPAHLAQDIGESLANLQVARIDLYWLHADDPSQPVGPIIDALVAHQRAGRIGHFGASNWSPARIAEAQAYARGIGHPGFVAIQPFWGLAVPNPEGAQAAGYGHYYEDGFQALHAGGLPVIAYAGQSRGFFSKLAAGEGSLDEGTKAMYLNDGNRRRLQVVEALAKQHGATINQVVLAYLLSQPYPTVPIIGASRLEQLADSVQAFNVRLSAAELARLRAGQ